MHGTCIVPLRRNKASAIIKTRLIFHQRLPTASDNERKRYMTIITICFRIKIWIFHSLTYGNFLSRYNASFVLEEFTAKYLQSQWARNQTYIILACLSLRFMPHATALLRSHFPHDFIPEWYLLGSTTPIRVVKECDKALQRLRLVPSVER